MVDWHTLKNRGQKMLNITKEQLAGHILKEFDNRKEYSGYLRLQKYMWYFLNFSKILEKNYLSNIDINYFDFRIWKYGPVIPEIWNKYSGTHGAKIEKKKIDESEFKSKEFKVEFDQTIDLLFNALKWIDDFQLSWNTHEELKEYYGENDEKYNENSNYLINEKKVNTQLINDFYQLQSSS